jgi:glycosyltransferase involved in cell wall biosynthesis
MPPSTSVESLNTAKKTLTEQTLLSNEADDKFETMLIMPSGVNRVLEGGFRTKGLFKQHETNKPLITVITVVFNEAVSLEKTMLSVLNQTYDNVEYIVIDGGNTDGTLDIIRQYDHAIDYWVSEKDEGIYDAMNKGIGLASGGWVNFMNSGDLFYSTTTLEKIVFKFKKKYSIVYGDVQAFSKKYHFKEMKISRPVTAKNLIMKLPICHQATFVTLKAFKEVGLYDTNYKICADHDWLLKALMAGNQATYVHQCIALNNRDGVSSVSLFKLQRERLTLALLHFNDLKPMIYLMALIPFLKIPFIFLFRKLNLIYVTHRFKIIKKP